MEQKVVIPETGMTDVAGTSAMARAQLLARQAVSPIIPLLDRPARRLRQLRRWRKGRFAILARPLALASFLGPGVIAANAGNDAGAVATWASVGALYGFQLL